LGYGILVINLPEALERRQRVSRHLADLGLDSVEIIDAVRGSLLSASERRLQADDARSVARYGRELTAGELGCALSHVRAYERLLAGRDEFALILEDDAVLLPDVVTLLHSKSVRDWLMQPESRVLLMTPVRAFLKRGALPLQEGYRLVRIRRAWEGYGYVVNRAAAEMMRRINSPAWLSADDWVAYRKLGGVELRGVDPFCIGFLDTAPSQLEDDRRQVETASGRSRSLGVRLEKWGRQFMDLAYYRPIWGLGRHRMPPGWPANRE
jgi:glycosyl transferase family 25